MKENAGEHSGSGMSSTSSIPSTASSASHKRDDLDLDSLFRRLDKYTAEMEEVEARLKQARTASQDWSHFDFTRFSFESGHLPDGDRPAFSVGDSPRASSSIRRSLKDQYYADNAVSVELLAQVDDTSTAQGNEDLAKGASAAWRDNDTEANLVASTHRGSRAESKVCLVEPVSVRSSKDPEQAAPSRQSTRRRSVSNSQSPDPPSRENSPEPNVDQPPLNLGTGSWNVAMINEGFDENDHHGENSSDDDVPEQAFPTTWTLPPRTSSKALPGTEMQGNSANTSSKPLPRRMASTEERLTVRNGGFWSMQAASLIDNQDRIPPVPALSQAGSTATLSPPPTPLSICSPQEDQLRRELEGFALAEGAETLGLRHRRRQPPMLDLTASDDEHEDSRSGSSPLGRSSPGLAESSDPKGLLGTRPRIRRQRSILSIFQRRSEVEKLIDMYFDDDQEETILPRRRSTKSKKASPLQRNTPESPPVPPLPPIDHSRKQASLD
jgi:hypothetical protein